MPPTGPDMASTNDIETSFPEIVPAAEAGLSDSTEPLPPDPLGC